MFSAEELLLRADHSVRVVDPQSSHYNAVGAIVARSHCTPPDYVTVHFDDGKFGNYLATALELMADEGQL